MKFFEDSNLDLVFMLFVFPIMNIFFSPGFSAVLLEWNLLHDFSQGWFGCQGYRSIPETFLVVPLVFGGEGLACSQTSYEAKGAL